MPVSVGLDAEGKPTQALMKKLEAVGLAGTDVQSLRRRVEGKSEVLFVDSTTPAMPLATALQQALDEAIAALPIPKVMSYQLADGETTVQFVRPAHGLVALHGGEVVPVKALGLEAGRITHGHRFQGARDISLANADEYEGRLEDEGAVVADFAVRRAAIAAKLREKSAQVTDRYDPPESLLDEVTALVERPEVYLGAFDEEFLAVPQECLVLTMQQNQKYFPLLGKDGKLLPRFMIVSNMKLSDPAAIVQGNERVIRPRLADARFFFETDKKSKLADRVPQLATIVYHNKLGTQAQRVERLRKLAVKIQETLPRGKAGREYADRAAYLAKADLVTLMVGEFPELQGVIGRYYAEADGEEKSVSRAIEQHYWPRFAGDALPDGPVAQAVALADKLETLAGLFGIGALPTGDKDPFGLRRAGIGVLRMLIEKRLALPLPSLLGLSFQAFNSVAATKPVPEDVADFLYDRLRGHLREQDYTVNQIEAVIAQRPSRIDLVPDQLAAVKTFEALPESGALSSANKRIVNILKKSGGEAAATVDVARLAAGAERDLWQSFETLAPAIDAHCASGDYTSALKALASAKPAVDRFFDDVMVMVDDEALRANRLALLNRVAATMNRVADISKLAA
jgi:glycyl-tRNA synthetase beta chain